MTRPARLRRLVLSGAAAVVVPLGALWVRPPLRAASPLEAPPVAPEAARAARNEILRESRALPDGRRVHRFRFPDGVDVEFPDMPRRPSDAAQRERVVFFPGTQPAADEPPETFQAAGEAAGLSPVSIHALRFVSRHEGGFDAINTWDGARFSWGFIQFAGGYGFPAVLGHMKTRNPEVFAERFARYGVDALPSETGRPEAVWVDADGGAPRRGRAAEQAFGDDPLVVALFIRAGRDRRVKQLQVEAAIRDYVLPALATNWQGRSLGELFPSPRFQALLIDRQVHEGNNDRIVAALDQVWAEADRPGPEGWTGLERPAMRRVLRDGEVRYSVSGMVEEGARQVQAAAAAFRADQDAAPALRAARQALRDARAALPAMSRGPVREGLAQGLEEVLDRTAPERLLGLQAPARADELDAAAGLLRTLPGRGRYENLVVRRLENLVSSPELDAARGEDSRAPGKEGAGLTSGAVREAPGRERR